MGMFWKIGFVGGLILMAVLTTQAYAENDHPVARACAEDYRNFCDGVQPGEGRIMNCFNQHRDELSVGCRTAFTNVIQTFVRQFVASCQLDVENNCQGVEPGQGRILRCLKNHDEEISQGCADLIERM